MSASKTVVDTKALLEELARLQAENERLARQGKVLTCKVSDKGAMSVYHGSRFPTTLYKSQWQWLLTDENVAKMRKFIVDHDGQLKDKDSE